MRTFHSGGIAGNDITQGLPRVDELLEARPPKERSYFK
jgi:DNA-directed RNA polymerase subunit beta'